MTRSRSSRKARKAQRHKEHQNPQAQPATTSTVAPHIVQASAPNALYGTNGVSRQTVSAPNYAKWELVLATLLAAVGAFQAFVTHRQLNAMVSQNELAKGQLKLAQTATEQTQESLDIMRLEQRPWVAVGGVEIDELVADQPLSYKLQLKNTGATPAYINKELAGVFVLPKNGDPSTVISESLPTAPSESVQAVFAPGAVTSIYPETNTQLSASDIQAVMRSDSVLYLFLIIEYSDSTKQARRTTACFKYDVGFKKFVANRTNNTMD